MSPKQNKTSNEVQAFFDKLKALLKAGNKKKVYLKNSKQETIIQITVTIAVFLSLILPFLAVIALILYLTGYLKIEVIDSNKSQK